jgi:TonB family protein
MEPFMSTVSTIGEAALTALWVPVMLWTMAASVLLFISSWYNGGYRILYSMNVALLLSLPAGLIAAQLINPLNWLPQTASSGPVIAFGYILDGVLYAPVAENETGTALLRNPYLYIGLLTIAVIPVVFTRLIRVCNSFRNLNRMSRMFEPVTDKGMLGRLGQLSASLNLARPVTLLRASDCRIPFTYGLLRPVIVIPEGTDESELDHILLHELTHIRRFDNLMLVIEQFIRTLFAFHPLVHRLARKSEHYREICCDAEVLYAQKSPDTSAYARTLVKYLQPDLPLDLTAGMAKPSNIKERILIMHKFGNSIPAGSRLAGRLAGLAMLGCLTLIMACTDNVNLLGDDASQTVQTEEFSAVPTADLVRELNEHRTRLGEMLRNQQVEAGSHTTEDGKPEVDPEIVSVMNRMNAIRLELQDRDDLPEDLKAMFARTQNTLPDPEVFTVVETMPQMIGGQASFYNALRYPEMARRAGIEGRVIVQYVVDEDGTVLNPRIIRGIGGGTDEAVIEALQQIRFTPGLQRGRPVKVQMTQPVVFRLSNDQAE